MSLFRRAGAKIAKFLESAADPALVADRHLLYAKDDGGDPQMFSRDPDGYIYQLTPVFGDWGDAIDGDGVMDGVAVVAGMAPALIGGIMVYTGVGRSYQFGSLQIDDGILFRTQGYRVLCHELTFVGDSRLSNNGTDAASATGGAGNPSGELGGGHSGGAGGVNVAGSVGSALAQAQPRTTTTSSALGGAAGSPGLDGNVASRGGGGGGGATTNAGGNGGTVTITPFTDGDVTAWDLSRGRNLLGTKWNGGSGGGGGGGGTAGTGGGGGGGAGCLVARAKRLKTVEVGGLRGFVSAIGGAGFNGVGTGGGGGGGGGGWVALYYGSLNGTLPAMTVPGGVGGAGGTGGAGGDGATGLAYVYRL